MIPTLETKGMDLSYVFRPCKDTACAETHGERIINDQSKRKNIQFSYENFSQTPFGIILNQAILHKNYQ